MFNLNIIINCVFNYNCKIIFLNIIQVSQLNNENFFIYIWIYIYITSPSQCFTMSLINLFQRSFHFWKHPWTSPVIKLFSLQDQHYCSTFIVFQILKRCTAVLSLVHPPAGSFNFEKSQWSQIRATYGVGRA